MLNTSFKPRESYSLKTDDIEGAKPFQRSYQYTNKLSYSNSTTGIEKSAPSSTEFLTNRITNPLNPEYKLPTHISKPITPPKFIKDTLDISDIKVTTSKPLYKKMIRDSLNVSDISFRRSTKAKTQINVTLDLQNDLNTSSILNSPKEDSHAMPAGFVKKFVTKNSELKSISNYIHTPKASIDSSCNSLKKITSHTVKNSLGSSNEFKFCHSRIKKELPKSSIISNHNRKLTLDI